MKFDDEEKELLEAFEKNEIQFTKISDEKKKYFSEIAKNTVEQKKMINFRVNERDFRNLKMKASELGIPYQTLLKILIHQFTEGKVKLNL